MGKPLKIVAAWIISKNTVLQDAFFCHILRRTKWRIQIFDPIARGNVADTANDCQLINHSHAEKDLKQSENINLLFNETSH